MQSQGWYFTPALEFPGQHRIKCSSPQQQNLVESPTLFKIKKSHQLHRLESLPISGSEFLM